jgi:hypothetical protein
MKLILLLVLFASASVSSPAKDLVATVSHEAQSYANALRGNNFEGIFAYTHPRIVTMMGGKEIMLAKLKRGTSPDGLLEVTMGAPSKPREIGSWLTSLVPQHIVAKVPGGKIIQDSVLLGISENAGKSWVFVDLVAFSKEQLAKMFPELDGKILLPEKKQEFRKD